MIHAARREQMVKKFVVNAGITDQRVIGAMREVPRHLFVDPALTHQAYLGCSLPIGFKQTISHPTTVARMTQALELSGSEKVLEIGTGSGYQAAVLAQTGAKVYTIERIAELAQKARHLFEQLKFYTIAVRTADGALGWPEFAPYHRIILTAHTDEIPKALTAQLVPGGILVMPLGTHDEQHLIRVIKTEDGSLRSEKIFGANFVPLINQRKF